MNAQKLKSVTRLLKKLQLTPEIKEEFKREAEKIEQEHRENENATLVQKIEREINQAHDKYELLIPESLKKRTLGEISAAGGSFYYDEDEGCHVLLVPQEIISVPADPSKIPSLAPNRYILGDASSVINKIQASAAKRKRSRLTANTPSHSMTTRKKQDRISRYSNTSADSSMIYPSTASYQYARAAVANSAIKRGIRSTAKKATSTVSRTKPSAVKAFQFKAPAPVQQSTRSTPKKMEAISPIFDTSDSDPLTRLTPYNPKTPNGNNRLFRKQPRRAKKDEAIIHCSTTGTPLIID